VSDQPTNIDPDGSSLESLDARERSAIYEAAKHKGGDIPRLQALPIADLMQIASHEGIEVLPGLGKQQLVFEILQGRFARTGLGWSEGVLEILPDGFGFLRSARHDFAPGPDDVYVSPTQVRRLNLKQGHLVAGPVRPPQRGEKYFALLHVEVVNGGTIGDLRLRIPFEERAPILPRDRLHLDHPGAGTDVRAIELLAPWGRGQRVLISAPPGCGRTPLLTNVAKALLHNHQDLAVLLCLLDERPEEVTEVRRQFAADDRAEVVATTFDALPERHTALAEMVLARAQRMVEAGRHVVLVLDSLTALVRAYNQELPHTGKVLTAGLDASALHRPKRLFGAARNLEDGGSLTVIATALTGTDSRIDQTIAEEFANKGNSEVALDRSLAEQRIYPALDVARTATRREDNLLDKIAVDALRRMRTELLRSEPRARIESLFDLLRRHASNTDLLASL
jgi:transcription termination factor Rho